MKNPKLKFLLKNAILVIVLFFFFNTNSVFAQTPPGGFHEETELTPILEISEEAFNLLAPAMTTTSDPSSRPNPEQRYSIKTILKEPWSFDGYQVEILGELTKIESLAASSDEDWKEGFVLSVKDHTGSIPVLYRGSLYKVEVGQDVSIAGVFDAVANAVNAEVVKPGCSVKPLCNYLPKNSQNIGTILVVLGIIPIILLLLPQKKPTLLLLLSMMMFLTACEIRIGHVISSDGTVKTSVQIMEEGEGIDFFRKIPGLDRYISGWILQNQDLGALVENWVAGKNEYFFLQNNYSTIEEFIKFKEDEEEPNSWVYVHSFPIKDEICYRYVAQVSPSELYEMPEDTNSAIAREVEKLIDDIQMPYDVTLPGKLLYTNAPSQTEKSAHWNLELKKTNVLIAESCYLQQKSEQLNRSWAWLAVFGIGLVTTGLWLLVVQKYRRQR